MLIPGPGPVVIGPEHPNSPQQWLSEEPVGAPFVVRTTGGPTMINLTWDALLEASEYLSGAQEVLNQQRIELQSALGHAVDLPAHYLVPVVQARVTGMLGLVASTEGTLAATTAGAQNAHGAYRDAESVAQRYFSLIVRLDEQQRVLENALHPGGDKSYVYDWTASTGTLLAGEAGRLALRRNRGLRQMVSVLNAVEKNAGASAYEMARHQHVVDAEPTGSFTHEGTGQMGDYMQSMAGATDEGDLAVTRVEKNGEAVYLVHLGGLDVNGADPQTGRGYRSLLDAVRNDSEHMAGVVDRALEAAEVPEGADIALSGYSMGGLHAMNLAQNQRLKEKFTLKSVTTIGSPGKNQRMDPEVPVIHLEDGRDPVPHVMGDRHQDSSSRLTVTYEYADEETTVDSPLGSAHTLEHNIAAVNLLEEREQAVLTDDERAHLDQFRGLYEGNAETFVYRTHWEEKANAEEIDWINHEGLQDAASEQIQRRIRHEFADLGKETLVPGSTDSFERSSSGGTVDRDTARQTQKRVGAD